MENNQKRNYRVVGAPVVKKDAKALVTGKPVYTDDLALKDCLIVKVLRSPYAHALITEIDCAVAAKMPGIECILTWKDVPQKRFTMAGQPMNSFTDFPSMKTHIRPWGKSSFPAASPCSA